MKILILANNGGGLYDFRNELITELLKYGEVIPSVPGSEYDELIENLGCRVIDTPIDRRGVNPIRDISLLLTYFKMLCKEKPDLVITYTIKPNVYGGIACRILKIPYAANITGLGTAFQNDGILRKLVTVMYKVALKKAKTVFFENSENMQILLNDNIVNEQQCCLLNGAGVNLEHYTYAKYPENDEPVRFLFIGRIMQEKGVNELFSAMERLTKDGFDCALDILGSYEENYAEKIKEYEKAGWLNFHGYQMDVRPFVANAHCFVLPSYHEGMANTNLECASMGRPLITSRIHGCMEAVVENESGLLCEVQNADSLYEKMKEFCLMPNEVREEMGKAGRRHMEEVFDKRKVVEATVKGLKL